MMISPVMGVGRYSDEIRVLSNFIGWMMDASKVVSYGVMFRCVNRICDVGGDRIVSTIPSRSRIRSSTMNGIPK